MGVGDRTAEASRPERAPDHVTGGLKQIECSSKREVQRLSAPRKPIILDFSSNSLTNSVQLEGWFDAELHGRWSGASTSTITIRGRRLQSPLRIMLIVRTLERILSEPQTLSLRVNESSCESKV